jgi:protein arginine N-methyltransferase 1
MLDYHHGLLEDPIRTEWYRDAIRRVVKPGDVVIDLGSGSGILSFFACEAGAAKVYAIEQRHMADVIHMLAKQNGLADRIEVIHEVSTDVELPERAAVLVTETLGSFGPEEQIVSYTIDARTRLLQPDGRIIPEAFTLSIVPVELPAVFDLHVSSWTRPRYGFDMSLLRVFASNRPYTASITPAAHLAPPTEFLAVDLMTVTTPLLTGRASFTIERAGTMHGFGGWFTAMLAADITLSNGTQPTGWSQAFLPLEEAIPVTPGTSVEVDVETHDGTRWRWKGRVGAAEFDQTSLLSMPPCRSLRSL